jgi:hypothetical protein
MPNDALPEEWVILRGWLPHDLEERARRFRFFQRARGVTDAERWLRMILMHVAGGLSLEQTVVRARELNLMEISAVALFKRLRNAGAWLQELCRHLLVEQQERLGKAVWPSGYAVRAIDATDIKEPGETGTTWRVHYSIRLPELVCDHYELTDDSSGEKLGRFEFGKGQLILADRGYSHRAGAAHVIESGADLLMRWNPTVFPVKAPGGKPFHLLQKVRALPRKSPREWPVEFEYKNKTYRARVCALRKTRTATERARAKVLEKARRNRTREVQSQSLELAEYILILTTLPPLFTAWQVLELYRCRWQIELSFKRLKTLLETGHVPKSDERSARAWMQAKILTALLLERLLLEAEIFSPWGYNLQHPEPVAHGARST